jgi:hypothetical protein
VFAPLTDPDKSSLFFAVLGAVSGRDAYAHAFGIAQLAATGVLFAAMLLSIPRRRRAPALDRRALPG